MKNQPTWIKNGIWNTAEHASTRILDAVATLVILWFVPTVKFSSLALAQAWVAPALLFFIAPETILYRDYSKWERQGRESMLARIRVLRRFAWGKGVAGIFLSLGIAFFSSSSAGSENSFLENFYALVWAFSLPLAPQIAGPDREFLRMDLKLLQLNFVTLFQRVLYLTLLGVAIRYYGASMAALAAAASFAVLLSAGIARFLVEKNFRGVAPLHSPENTFRAVITKSLTGFSIWNHLAGVVIGWMQTMDLFFLGLFHFSPLDIGLYSTILKLANFALAAPFAFSNFYAVHLGRVPPGQGSEQILIEWKRMLRLSGVLFAFVLGQALLFWAASPWILATLSRGRWTEPDIRKMLDWLSWILPSCALFGSLLLWTSWLNVRTSIRSLVLNAYLPWGVVALFSYGYFIAHFGPEGAAKANLLVVGALVPLLGFATHRAFQVGLPYGKER